MADLVANVAAQLAALLTQPHVEGVLFSAGAVTLFAGVLYGTQKLGEWQRTIDQPHIAIKNNTENATTGVEALLLMEVEVEAPAPIPPAPNVPVPSIWGHPDTVSYTPSEPWNQGLTVRINSRQVSTGPSDATMLSLVLLALFLTWLLRVCRPNAGVPTKISPHAPQTKSQQTAAPQAASSQTASAATQTTRFDKPTVSARAVQDADKATLSSQVYHQPLSIGQIMTMDTPPQPLTVSLPQVQSPTLSIGRFLTVDTPPRPPQQHMDLQDQKQTYEAKAEALIRALKASHSENVAALEQKLATMQADHETARADAEARALDHEQLQSEEVAALNEQTKKLQVDNETAKSAAESRIANLKTLQSDEVATLKQQIELLQAEKATAETRARDSEKSHSEDVAALEQRFEAVQTEKQVAEAKAEASFLDHQRSSKEATSLHEQIENLLAVQESNEAVSKGRILEFETELAGAKGEVELLRPQAASLSQQVESLQAEKDLVEERLTASIVDLGRLSEEAADLKRKCQRLQVDKATAEKEAEARANKLQMELTVVRSERETSPPREKVDLTSPSSQRKILQLNTPPMPGRNPKTSGGMGGSKYAAEGSGSSAPTSSTPNPLKSNSQVGGGLGVSRFAKTGLASTANQQQATSEQVTSRQTPLQQGSQHEIPQQEESHEEALQKEAPQHTTTSSTAPVQHTCYHCGATFDDTEKFKFLRHHVSKCSKWSKAHENDAYVQSRRGQHAIKYPPDWNHELTRRPREQPDWLRKAHQKINELLGDDPLPT